MSFFEWFLDLLAQRWEVHPIVALFPVIILMVYITLITIIVSLVIVYFFRAFKEEWRKEHGSKSFADLVREKYKDLGGE